MRLCGRSKAITPPSARRPEPTLLHRQPRPQRTRHRTSRRPPWRTERTTRPTWMPLLGRAAPKGLGTRWRTAPMMRPASPVSSGPPSLCRVGQSKRPPLKALWAASTRALQNESWQLQQRHCCMQQRPRCLRSRPPRRRVRQLRPLWRLPQLRRLQPRVRRQHPPRVPNGRPPRARCRRNCRRGSPPRRRWSMASLAPRR
mmetsp:Transcript_25419/g.85006  ORF Transcript_25419/g.85006 Transcript_25419/m.85006 type:complete len:200 (+) Transcript_25419:691-1290(+)